jgi:hypothetical protein
MKYNKKTQPWRGEKEGNANGKMGGLNNGNKGTVPDAIRVIFRTYECEFKMYQSVRHGIRFQYSIHIFLLKGGTGGLALSHNIWEFMYFGIPRGALDHILIATEVKRSDPSTNGGIVKSTETCSHCAFFIQMSYLRGEKAGTHPQVKPSLSR